MWLTAFVGMATLSLMLVVVLVVSVVLLRGQMNLCRLTMEKYQLENSKLVNLTMSRDPMTYQALQAMEGSFDQDKLLPVGTDEAEAAKYASLYGTTLGLGEEVTHDDYASDFSELGLN